MASSIACTNNKAALVEEGDILTTLSDNSVMWVYFNVPESRYLEYMTNLKDNKDLRIELKLANGQVFEHLGKIGAIEADFNNTTGNIAFSRRRLPQSRSTAPSWTNRHCGAESRKAGAIVIAQRAVFEILASDTCLWLTMKTEFISAKS